jgi:putative hydrolase of the HAD superfamily
MVSGFGCVLDLDDTLYLERDYVRSGFRFVADLVGVDNADADATFEFLWAGFVDGTRGSSFDALIAGFPEVGRTRTVDDLVSAYREHLPRIELFPGMRDLVDDLVARGISLAVISDGARVSQVTKATALRVGEFADPVVLTDVWGRAYWKPHPRAYEVVEKRLGLAPERLVYVGDNPAKDFVSPMVLGWSGIRLRLPGQLHEATPLSEGGVLEVTTVADLHTLVLALAESDADRKVR